MHIAFVTTESPYGDSNACGIGSYLRAIIPALLDAGHRITVFANAKEETKFDAEGGRVSVYHFRLPSAHWYAAKLPLVRRMAPLPLRQLEWSAAFYRRVATVAGQTKIDVIESTEAGSLFLSRIAPLVIRLHGSELVFRRQSEIPVNSSVRWNDTLEAYSCKRAAAITAPSQFQANEMIQRRGWPAERVHVIPNPISKSLLNAALKLERNGGAERIVLYAGRLAPVKGIDTLLEAAKLAHARNPSVTFVLAGPWQMPHPPRAYGLELERKSADGVRWVGPQAQNDLIDWYKRSALFVMPSNYESFGISIIEALAFGLRVIATDTGGSAEVLRGNGLASIVPKRDPKALADEIIRFISLPPVSFQMRNAARDRVCSMFAPERIVAATLPVYERVQNRFQK